MATDETKELLKLLLEKVEGLEKENEKLHRKLDELNQRILEDRYEREVEYSDGEEEYSDYECEGPYYDEYEPDTSYEDYGFSSQREFEDWLEDEICKRD